MRELLLPALLLLSCGNSFCAALTQVVRAWPPLGVPISQFFNCSSDYLASAAAAARSCLPRSPGASPDAGLYAPQCGRLVRDDLASRAEADALLAMMQKAFRRSRVAAGPTLADINSGLMRDSEQGIMRLYQDRPARAASPSGGAEVAEGAEGAGLEGEGDDGRRVSFTREEYALYRSLVERARAAVAAHFGVEDGALFFTAPTFVTRIRGSADYRPAEVHDEYFWPHVDRLNTRHYDYSGLLYLSRGEDAGAAAGEGAAADEYRRRFDTPEARRAEAPDFTGGNFAFLRPRGEPLPDAAAEAARVRDLLETGPLSPPERRASVDQLWDAELEVVPRPGRFVAFTAGEENVHHVARVLSGERFVLSLWFSCDARRAFSNFLDGQEHRVFDAAPRGSGAPAEPEL
jgi:hypothetical protein